MFPTRRLILGACASIVLPPTLAASANAAGPLLTALDGEAVLLRGSDRFALAEGVALQPDDILQISDGARFAQLEFPDGVKLALGPGSRALLAPRLTGERAGGRLYLLSGWAKLATPGAPAATRAALLTPALDVASPGGTLVISVQSTATQLFAESGAATIRRKGASPQTLAAGQLLSLSAADGAKPDIASRPTPPFIATMPRAFMDALPTRAAKFQDHPIAPRRSGPLVYADAQPWLDAEAALRHAYLARWRNLAHDPEFRRGLIAGLDSHPEWGPVLTPPSGKPSIPAYNDKRHAP